VPYEHREAQREQEHRIAARWEAHMHECAKTGKDLDMSLKPYWIR
jgi:hypothetical protein